MRRMSPSFLRWLARWLLGAMLLATLAPAVSRTLTATREAGDWVEICTTEGMRWAQVGVDDPAQADGLLHALDRCGHCTLAADRFAPLVSVPPGFAIDAGPHTLPRHNLLPFRAMHAPSPGARGPPLLS